jgi:hypothetical protein
MKISSDGDRDTVIPLYIREFLAGARNHEVNQEVFVSIANEGCLGPSVRTHSRNRHYSILMKDANRFVLHVRSHGISIVGAESTS